jgi:hypothetical protein
VLAWAGDGSLCPALGSPHSYRLVLCQPALRPSLFAPAAVVTAADSDVFSPTAVWAIRRASATPAVPPTPLEAHRLPPLPFLISLAVRSSGRCSSLDMYRPAPRPFLRTLLPAGLRWVCVRRPAADDSLLPTQAGPQQADRRRAAHAPHAPLSLRTRLRRPASGQPSRLSLSRPALLLPCLRTYTSRETAPSSRKRALAPGTSGSAQPSLFVPPADAHNRCCPLPPGRPVQPTSERLVLPSFLSLSRRPSSLRGRIPSTPHLVPPKPNRTAASRSSPARFRLILSSERAWKATGRCSRRHRRPRIGPEAATLSPQPARPARRGAQLRRSTCSSSSSSP